MCLSSKQLRETWYHVSRYMIVYDKWRASVTNVVLEQIFKHCYMTSRLRTSYRHGACVIHGWVTHKSQIQDRINFPANRDWDLQAITRRIGESDCTRGALLASVNTLQSHAHAGNAPRVHSPYQTSLLCVQNTAPIPRKGAARGWFMNRPDISRSNDVNRLRTCNW